MRSFLRRFTLVLIAGASAEANDTALNQGRWGPEPIGGTEGPESPIRMVREDLRIEFGRESTDVAARFTFRNSRAGAPLRQLLGFPDVAAADAEQLRRDRQKDPKATLEGENSTGPLERMTTFVNGKRRPSALRYGEIALDKNKFPLPWRKRDGETTRLMAWYAVEVDFPADKDVTIERHYRVRNGWQVYRIGFFNYTTATGGVWQGTIGRMTADVFLEDGLKVKDLAWDDVFLPKQQVGGIKMQPAVQDEWRTLSPTHIRLTWKDFEPRIEKERRGFTVALKSQWKGKFGDDER